MVKNLGEKYSPVYFLAALGPGGLAVSFFMYPMFMVDHKGVPLATFDFIYPVLTGSSPLISVPLAFSLVMILFLGFLHIKYLIWNISEYRKFKQTEKYHEMKNSHNAVTFMAIPLTLAMTVNVMFVIGAVFIPKLWTIVEYLFPGAMLAFVAIGVYALVIFSDYFTKFIMKGNFEYSKNNNLTQMLAIFAFSMVAVGLAAPTAMTHYKIVSGISLFFSVFFLTTAVFLSGLKFTLGMKSVFRYGLDKESSASLWIAIPILTLMGITMVRLTYGLSHNFDTHANASILYVITSVIFSLQIMFGLIGYKVMKLNGYFKEYVSGNTASPGSLALICPGVAIVVFGFFFVHYGVVKNGITDKFSIFYFLLIAPLTLIQIKTLLTVFKLNGKLFNKKSAEPQSRTV